MWGTESSPNADRGGLPLTAQNLTHRYGEIPVLADVTFTVEQGATALVGVNGAGKSTLLSILAGGLRPTQGTVRIDSSDPFTRSERKAAISKVALMPQYFSPPKNMAALEVVTYIGWMRGLAWATARSRAEQCLETVGLAAKSGVPSGELSGGMVRRVALAQALVAHPRLLLLDEPSTGLDPEQRRMMVDLIKDLKPSTAVLFSSHVMEDVRDVAQRIVILDAGEIAFTGSIEELEALAPSGSMGAKTEAAFLSLVAARRSAR